MKEDTTELQETRMTLNWMEKGDQCHWQHSTLLETKDIIQSKKCVLPVGLKRLNTIDRILNSKTESAT